MNLEVQKYLRSGKTLKELNEELGIKANILGNLVLLNYSQIDSPKTNPIVMECRSLVLELNTWNIVSMGFRRFFNYGEVKESSEGFDFKHADAIEKVDGSFIQVFWYDNRWYMTTRGTIEGTGNVNLLNMTFKQLFDVTVKKYPDFWDNIDKKLIYIFELVSPENQVVKMYSDKALYLTALRNTYDFSELSYSMMEIEAKSLGVRIPRKYSFKNIEALFDLAAGLKDLDEGFVCVDYSKLYDGNYRRLKVKNPAYVAISHAKESGGKSVRSLMRLVWTGEHEEFVTYFPQFSPIISKLKSSYDVFHVNITRDIDEAKKRKSCSRKEFAMWAQSTVCPSVMFMVYDGKVNSFKNHIDEMMKNKGEKFAANFIIDTIGVRNINPDQEFETISDQ